MSAWFKKNKAIFILMGIVFVTLALLLVPAYTRTAHDLIVAEQGAGLLNVLPKMFDNIDKFGENLGYSFGDGSAEYWNNLKVMSILLICGGLYLMFTMKNDGEYKDIEHGSGDWAKGEEYEVLSKKEGFVLSANHFLPVIPTPPLAKNGNILVIGGSGSGKSASFAIPNAFQMLGSYIFTDPKGELYDRTAGIFKKKGYQIHVINLADPKYSDGYNPLSHIRGTTDVDIVAKIISKKDDKGGAKGGDPFWDQTSEALLKAVMYYILLTRPQEEHSLASCLALVRLGGENEGEDLMKLFMDLPFDNPARRAFETIRLGSEKTFSNILVSLAAKLEAFDSEEIAALTSTNTIEFEELAKVKSVVYFITPESHSTYDFLMNIFFSQLFQRLYEFGDQNGGALPVPMFLILDEFANIGRIPNFERVLSTCRSKKLHISIILQSIDQLMEIYDEKVTENIMANCSTHLFLGSNAQKTLETFSKQLGEKTIKRDSVSKNEDKDGHTSGRGYSDQIMARALMTPDELRRMSTQECIILIQGMRPIKAQKYWYYKMHPLRKEARESEISHLDSSETKRGEYRITNPYEIIAGGEEGGFGMPSFDDIFGAPPAATKSTQNVQVERPEPVMATASQVETMSTGDLFKGTGAPPVQEPVTSTPPEEYDLQAELEKRFDELFGAPKKKKNTYAE
ncbi:MAG: type IV secretory system conjugative DNA transfer family protein [Clostridia bacterium]|nr:type IV secretory system conjugative DNA transfer family protein [Clostridia bacterium]